MQTLDRLSLLALELQRGARREPAPDFVEWAFGALKQQLPFDTAMWATGYVEPGLEPVMQTAHLHRQPPQMLVDYAAIGGSDVLLAAAVSQPGISLWRSDAARPYTEPERQLMQAVFPHLIEARTQNRLLQLVQARRCAPLDRLTAREREVAMPPSWPSRRRRASRAGWAVPAST